MFCDYSGVGGEGMCRLLVPFKASFHKQVPRSEAIMASLWLDWALLTTGQQRCRGGVAAR